MTGNLIIGAGGHGKVIADCLRLAGAPVLGFLDDNSALWGQYRLGLPILDAVERWKDFSPTGLVMGIGVNGIRRQIVDRLPLDVPWITVRHPQAIVADSVRIDAGTVLMAGAIVNPDTIIGAHSIINTGATVDHDCQIGDFVHIAPGCNLAGGVLVGNNSLLGIGCKVIPNCRIGANCTIGAGAVVVGDIPSGVMAKGVPARWT